MGVSDELLKEISSECYHAEKPSIYISTGILGSIVSELQKRRSIESTGDNLDVIRKLIAGLRDALVSNVKFDDWELNELMGSPELVIRKSTEYIAEKH